MIQVQVVDGRGTRRAAQVSRSGELVVGPLTASVPASVTLVAAGGAHNFCQPVPGREYRITDIILTTNKDIGVDGATITVYEATSAASTVVTKQLVKMQMLKNSSMVLTGIHWKVTEGRFLNVKTDDNTVYCTIASHVVEVYEDNPATVGKGADV